MAIAAENGRGRGFLFNDIVEVVWPDPDEMPETFFNGVHQFMHTLRCTLLPLGVTVCGRHARHIGYWIEEA